MNIRLVFDNIIDDVRIPNALPQFIIDDMIPHVKLKGHNIHSYRQKYTMNNGFLPYASNWDLYFTTQDVDMTSTLNFNTEGYITSTEVTYLYLINTAGNFHYGMNPVDEQYKELPLKTSYIENLSDIVVDSLKTKSNFFLYFRNQQEGLTYTVLEQIYHHCKERDIPLEKIIIQTDSANFDELKEEFEKKYNLPLNVKYFMYPWALQLSSENIKELTQQKNIVNGFKRNREYKVVCLNKRLKDYRIAIISFLLGKKYDNMFLSYDTNFGKDYKFIKELKVYNGQDNIDNSISTLSEGYEIFLSTQKRIADKMDTDFDKVYFDDYKMYENSYFSIVTESTFFGNLRLTEKIGKPIINYHPFVVVGPANFLKLLKFYGFKTFGEFWDESYDDEIQPHERFIKITKVIDNLMNLTTKEWDVLTKKLESILIYNRNHLETFKCENVSKEFYENLQKIIKNQFNNKYHSILCSE